MPAGRKIIPVILCGGSGQRLWPQSTDKKPKQFLTLLTNNSLLQETAMRAMALSSHYDVSDMIIVTLAAWAGEARAHITALNDFSARMHYLCEPSGQGTLAAVTLAMSYIQDKFGPQTSAVILPSDHHIDIGDGLRKTIGEAFLCAQDGKIISIGIVPTHPEPSYGYIKQASNSNAVERFLEKPPMDLAQNLHAQEGWLWNAGMHLARAGAMLSQIEKHGAPKLKLVRQAVLLGGYETPDAPYYGLIKKESFEAAILQKSDALNVVRAQFSWSDIGRWKTVWSAADKDDQGNVLKGSIFCDNVQDSLIYGGKRTVSCIGLKNTVIIDTDDVVFVANIDSAENIRALLNKIPLSRSSHLPSSAQQITKSETLTMTHIIVQPNAKLEREPAPQARDYFVKKGIGEIAADNHKFCLYQDDFQSVPAHKKIVIINKSDDDLHIFEIINHNDQFDAEPDRPRVQA